MERILSITMSLMLSIIAYAQQEVTRFLGIPVDGSKAEMVRKLKEKGFRNDLTTDALVGEFNGATVNVFVVTNNNKVCRIMVADAHVVDERSIQIRFNLLCQQFASSPRYISLQDYTIPEDEDISREMTVHKKRYEAIFYNRRKSLTLLSLEKNCSLFYCLCIQRSNGQILLTKFKRMLPNSLWNMMKVV